MIDKILEERRSDNNYLVVELIIHVEKLVVSKSFLSCVN